MTAGTSASMTVDGSRSMPNSKPQQHRKQWSQLEPQMTMAITARQMKQRKGSVGINPGMTPTYQPRKRRQRPPFHHGHPLAAHLIQDLPLHLSHDVRSRHDHRSRREDGGSTSTSSSAPSRHPSTYGVCRPSTQHLRVRSHSASAPARFNATSASF